MPDLASSPVLTWLQGQEPGSSDFLDSPLVAIEGNRDVEAALVRLGQALDAALARDPVGLSAALQSDPARDEVRTALGQLGAARTLRIVGWVMEAGLPESDIVLGAVLAPDPAGGGQFLQAALSAAMRPSLLERLYAPDRLAALLAACQPQTELQEAA